MNYLFSLKKLSRTLCLLASFCLAVSSFPGEAFGQVNKPEYYRPKTRRLVIKPGETQADALRRHNSRFRRTKPATTGTSYYRPKNNQNGSPGFNANAYRQPNANKNCAQNGVCQGTTSSSSNRKLNPSTYGNTKFNHNGYNRPAASAKTSTSSTKSPYASQAQRQQAEINRRNGTEANIQSKLDESGAKHRQNLADGHQTHPNDNSRQYGDSPATQAGRAGNNYNQNGEGGTHTPGKNPRHNGAPGKQGKQASAQQAGAEQERQKNQAQAGQQGQIKNGIYVQNGQRVPDFNTRYQRGQERLEKARALKYKCENRATMVQEVCYYQGRAEPPGFKHGDANEKNMLRKKYADFHAYIHAETGPHKIEELNAKAKQLEANGEGIEAQCKMLSTDSHALGKARLGIHTKACAQMIKSCDFICNKRTKRDLAILKEQDRRDGNFTQVNTYLTNTETMIDRITGKCERAVKDVQAMVVKSIGAMMTSQIGNLRCVSDLTKNMDLDENGVNDSPHLQTDGAGAPNHPGDIGQGETQLQGGQTPEEIEAQRIADVQERVDVPPEFDPHASENVNSNENFIGENERPTNEEIMRMTPEEYQEWEKRAPYAHRREFEDFRAEQDAQGWSFGTKALIAGAAGAGLYFGGRALYKKGRSKQKKKMEKQMKDKEVAGAPPEPGDDKPGKDDGKGDGAGKDGKEPDPGEPEEPQVVCGESPMEVRIENLISRGYIDDAEQLLGRANSIPKECRDQMMVRMNSFRPNPGRPVVRDGGSPPVYYDNVGGNGNYYQNRSPNQYGSGSNNKQPSYYRRGSATAPKAYARRDGREPASLPGGIARGQKPKFALKKPKKYVAPKKRSFVTNYNNRKKYKTIGAVAKDIVACKKAGDEGCVEDLINLFISKGKLPQAHKEIQVLKKQNKGALAERLQRSLDSKLDSMGLPGGEVGISMMN